MRLRLTLAALVLSVVGALAQSGPTQPTTAPNPPNGDYSNRIATTKWVTDNAGGGGGGVNSVTCGTGLSGGTIITTGTCAVIYGTSASTSAQGNDTRITGAAQKSANLSDLANTATALTNLGGVPTSRTITAGTGLTGGGDLSSNRTLSFDTIATARVMANVSGISAVPSANTLTAILDSIMGSTQGSILYRNNSAWTVLTPGTSGQFLTSGGAAANVSWTSSAGTVTSVGITGGTGLDVSGSPITTSGSITVTPNGKLGDIAGLSMTQGSVMYYNGTNLVNLGPGTAGTVLTTQGVGANPIWTAAPSGNVPVGGTTGQVLAKASGTDYDTTWQTITGTGTMVGPVSSTDKAIVRWNSTTAIDTLDSGVIIDDSNNITGVATLTLPNTGLHLLDTNASHDLIIVPGSDLSADRNFTIATGDAARTLTMAGDATISGTNTGDQTITLSGVISGSGTSGITTTFVDDSITALVGLSPVADRLAYYTGTNTATLAILTSAGRDLIGGASASAQRTTLGLGTIATQAASSVTITGGSITGITDLALADGGTAASLADPGADRIMFWDDSGTTVDWLTVGSGLSISGTTLTASGGNAVDVQTFTSSGTWTKPSSASSTSLVYVQIWGAGGGGSTIANGGGGGGGAYRAFWANASDLGSTETVTVGSGGSTNNAGGNSSFGSLGTAYGGGGGSSSGAGGSTGGGGGGISSAGINGSSSTGGNGGNPNGGAGGDSSGSGADGGSSTLGGGGGGDNQTLLGGDGGSSLYGGGGGGGGANNSGASDRGGSGGDSVYGGAGGAAQGADNNGTAGTSLYGGNGGSVNSAGTAPGGGGGRNAAGADGRVVVYTWP